MMVPALLLAVLPSTLCLRTRAGEPPDPTEDRSTQEKKIKKKIMIKK
jgi:hypothetical protein